MNIVNKSLEIKNPKTNRRNAGFTDEEREKMTVLLNDGFTDSFRYLHPDEVTYSWWSYRFKVRKKYRNRSGSYTKAERTECWCFF